MHLPSRARQLGASHARVFRPHLGGRDRRRFMTVELADLKVVMERLEFHQVATPRRRPGPRPRGRAKPTRVSRTVAILRARLPCSPSPISGAGSPGRRTPFRSSARTSMTSSVPLGDDRVLALLESWMQHPDRHIGGNAAVVIGSLGDPRGFEVIASILDDRSDRTERQGVSCARRNCWSLRLQIAADHYVLSTLQFKADSRLEYGVKAVFLLNFMKAPHRGKSRSGAKRWTTLTAAKLALRYARSPRPQPTPPRTLGTSPIAMSTTGQCVRAVSWIIKWSTLPLSFGIRFPADSSRRTSILNGGLRSIAALPLQYPRPPNRSQWPGPPRTAAVQLRSRQRHSSEPR